MTIKAAHSLKRYSLHAPWPQWLQPQRKWCLALSWALTEIDIVASLIELLTPNLEHFLSDVLYVHS